MLLAVVECCLLPLGYEWDRFDAQHFRDIVESLCRKDVVMLLTQAFDRHI